ncbi:PTS transporter subunit EIIC [Corynebacterium hansenii]|uniref:PTS transporter subunit EIIC n=1 Tax=Corynebacterium hansenii TaxID=394964 RepID=A0ABV7ZNK4_9CORY|nr:PTS transporter subunit EIIC [Corynebacterium hansenii]
MKNLQKLGRSLMLPIAVLPAAALLLRLGQDDMLGRWESITVLKWLAAIFAAGGGALFDNLPLLFAVGVSIGWAKKADGSTALAAVVGYLVLTGVFKALSPMVLEGEVDQNGDQLMINYGVLAGLIMGLVAAMLWQRYHRKRLPEYLGFFNGRRFVPIVVGFAAVVIAIPMVLVYPWFNQGLTWFGDMISENTVGGGFVYGTVNRLLIPIGLHHLLNFVPWFMLGSFEGDAGVVHGDIARFLAGDPTAGAFMTGFFPIMMFALPAAALAMYHTARPAQKKVTGGAMVSLALTAFLTGITEPLEFAFMFLAWPLYVTHAVLTGSSLAVMNLVGARDGFGFSAGAIDFLLNLGIAEKPWAIVVAGLVYAVIYYAIFRIMIVKLDLKTPGRDPELDPIVPESELTTKEKFDRTAQQAQAAYEPDPSEVHARMTQDDADRAVIVERDAAAEKDSGK